MKKNSFIKIDCSDAALFSDKTQYREADFTEKIKMRLHYLFCKSCRKYQVNNNKLTKLIKNARIQTCTKDEKEGYQKIIQKNF